MAYFIKNRSFLHTMCLKVQIIELTLLNEKLCRVSARSDIARKSTNLKFLSSSRFKLFFHIWCIGTPYCRCCNSRKKKIYDRLRFWNNDNTWLSTGLEMAWKMHKIGFFFSNSSFKLFSKIWHEVAWYHTLCFHKKKVSSPPYAFPYSP